MQYLYHENSGDSTLKLSGDGHRYISKVRRHKVGDEIFLRNLRDGKIYSYKIDSISRREALLYLQDSRKLELKSKRKLHIGWCIIEPKHIERTLPTLNQLGVTSITFIYCERSQRNFKIDFGRLERILLNSSQQSGRSELMRLEIIESLKDFLKRYPESHLLNFSQNTLNKDMDIKSVVVGCEGGFTADEIALFENIVGFDTPLILKSETAVSALASKLLL